MGYGFIEIIKITKMKTLVSAFLIIFFGIPLLYIFCKKEGRYTITTSNTMLDIPLTTDSICEDTIQHKITFTDLNFHQKYIIHGNYVIEPK